MKNIFSTILILAFSSFLMAQSITDSSLVINPPHEPVKEGKNNFAIFGNAEIIYFQDKNNSQFTELNFKPIFLWKISDKLFVEAEPEFETGGGSLDIGLEYANMVYIVNPYLTLHAGRFLPKFGAYRGRMGEGFINRFSTSPVGFGDGGIGAMNEVGVGAQGGFGAGSAKINYELYISNGPQILSDPEDTANFGQFDYEAYAGNNNSKAVGGRIGLLPFSNSSLEIAYSFQTKSKTGEKGTLYENTGVNMHAFDLNYWGHLLAIKSDVRLMAEWKHQNVNDAIYYDANGSAFSFKNAPTAYYVAATIRPAHLVNSLFRNTELAARYSEYKRPDIWGGATHQFALSLDYWLKWNTVLKLTYQKQKDIDNAFYAQLVFGF